MVFDEECYYYEDLSVLIDFSMLNPSLENYHPLQIGYQVWKDNRLQVLVLSGMHITTIPESINNLDHLEHLHLPDGSDDNLGIDHLASLNAVYFQNDLAVLQSFIDMNKSLEGKHPLEIGQQKWEDMRLVSLDLSDNELTDIPVSICNILPNLKQ